MIEDSAWESPYIGTYSFQEGVYTMVLRRESRTSTIVMRISEEHGAIAGDPEPTGMDAHVLLNNAEREGAKVWRAS